MSEVISSFRSLRAGSQVFALLMVFLCVMLHTMSSALWYVVLVCHQYDVCETSVVSVYVGGLSGGGLCIFCKLCPICFLVVGKGPSVLL